MADPETNEFSNYIVDLTNKTQAGDITWAKVNPSTFAWDAPSGNGRLVLQRVTRQILRPAPHVERGFLFQVFDSAGVAQLSMDGLGKQDIREVLSALFQTIEAAIVRRGLDFMKTLLPPK